MKCSDFEKDIYLYKELTPQERAQFDAHVSKCDHCLQRFNAVRSLHKAFEMTLSEAPQPRHHAALTRQIMDAVEGMQQRKRFPLKDILRSIIVAPVRYQMACLSMVLVVFFATEYTSDMHGPKIMKPYRRLPGAEAELDLAAFHAVFLQTKKERNESEGIADCVAFCLKAHGSDCKACAEKFVKP